MGPLFNINAYNIPAIDKARLSPYLLLSPTTIYYKHFPLYCSSRYRIRQVLKGSFPLQLYSGY